MARYLRHAAVVVALLGVSAHAGEIKIHEWPTVFIPQEVATIPVVMDVGYYVLVKDQDNLRIKLQQKSIHVYEGCVDVVVTANFDMTLSCSITATGAVPGTYTCTVTPANVDSPGGTSTICATLTDANLLGVPGGEKDVHVATVKLKVVPR
jgi:hypothetical protein